MFYSSSHTKGSYCIYNLGGVKCPLSLKCSWRASEASETLLGVTNGNRIYIFITYVRKMDQSDRSIGVDYISIFHPNNPPHARRVRRNGYQ